MRHLAEAVASRNASLVLVNDVPLLQGDPLDCTPLASRLGSWCPSVCGRSRAESVAELADAATTLAGLANEFPRSVYFTDAHDWLCDGDTCGPYIHPGRQLHARLDGRQSLELRGCVCVVAVARSPLIASLTGTDLR